MKGCVGCNTFIFHMLVARVVGQGAQNSTVGCGGRLVALATQRDQVTLELTQFLHAFFHRNNVLVEQVVDVGAVVGGGVAVLQQAADFVERHVERAAMANEAQSFDVLVAINAVIPGAAGGCRKQPLAFVVADCFYRGLGTLRQFADAQCHVCSRCVSLP